MRQVDLALAFARLNTAFDQSIDHCAKFGIGRGRLVETGRTGGRLGTLGRLLGQSRNGLQNGSLRPLDQSWRLSDSNDSEVILLFRLKRAKGPAGEMATAPDSPSPTRVWLHGLPGRGNDKRDDQGFIQQDTYVRVYLPVKPPGAR